MPNQISDSEHELVKELVAKHWTSGVGSPHEIMEIIMADPDFPQSEAAREQLEAAFGSPRVGKDPAEHEADYDDVVQQTFPASDPPPLP